LIGSVTSDGIVQGTGISNVLTKPGRGSKRHGRGAARREGALSDAR